MSSSINRFFSSSTKSTSAPVSDLRESFADLVTGSSTPVASPAFSGKLFSGGVLSAPTVKESCTFGPSFVSLSRVNDVCGGYIGSGSRFCCRNKSECTINSHTKKKYSDIKPGVYLKSQGEDAFTSPFTPADRLGSEAIKYLLSQDFGSPQAARVKLELINQREDSLVSAEDVENLFNSNPTAGSFTPMKRKFVQPDLKTKLDSALGVVDEEESSEGVPDQTFTTYMKDLTKTVEESHVDLAALWDDFHELKSQVGVLPAISCPPSLWAAHLENKSDIEELNKTFD